MNVLSGHQDLHEIAKYSELFLPLPSKETRALNFSVSVVREYWLALSAKIVLKIQDFTELQLEGQRILETVLTV